MEGYHHDAHPMGMLISSVAAAYSSEIGHPFQDDTGQLIGA